MKFARGLKWEPNGRAVLDPKRLFLVSSSCFLVVITHSSRTGGVLLWNIQDFPKITQPPLLGHVSVTILNTGRLKINEYIIKHQWS